MRCSVPRISVERTTSRPRSRASNASRSKPGEPGPQADERRLGLLRLQADQALDGRQGRDLLPRQQHLPGEQGPIQRVRESVSVFIPRMIRILDEDQRENRVVAGREAVVGTLSGNSEILRVRFLADGLTIQ